MGHPDAPSDVACTCIRVDYVLCCFALQDLNPAEQWEEINIGCTKRYVGCLKRLAGMVSPPHHHHHHHA